MSFGKMMSKAKIKIMKESQEPEPEDEPGIVVHHHFFVQFSHLKACIAKWKFGFLVVQGFLLEANYPRLD